MASTKSKKSHKFKKPAKSSSVSKSKKIIRPRVSRDSRGRFISTIRKKKHESKSKTRPNKPAKRKNSKTVQRRVLSRLSKAKTTPNIRKRKSGPRKYAGRKSRIARSSRNPARIPFLDGMDLKGFDPDFGRRVEIRDRLKDIHTKANYLPNRVLGIEDAKLEIQKRSITFLTPKAYPPGQAPDMDQELTNKVKQFYNAEGPGIYYFKARLIHPVLDFDGFDRIGDKWISAPRYRINSIKDVENKMYSLLETLRISTETNIYGLRETGYAFAEFEIERI